MGRFWYQYVVSFIQPQRLGPLGLPVCAHCRCQNSTPFTQSGEAMHEGGKKKKETEKAFPHGNTHARCRNRRALHSTRRVKERDCETCKAQIHVWRQSLALKQFLFFLSHSTSSTPAALTLWQLLCVCKRMCPRTRLVGRTR